MIDTHLEHIMCFDKGVRKNIIYIFYKGRLLKKTRNLGIYLKLGVGGVRGGSRGPTCYILII